MTKKEILEGNKIIAKFMDVKIGVDDYMWGPGRFCKLSVKHLAYDSSWGWLMPVIEKLAKRKKHNLLSTLEDLFKYDTFLEIESLFKVVVEEIHYINELEKA